MIAEGPTYAIQYYADSKADYNRYLEIYAPDMREDHLKNGVNSLLHSEV